MKTADSIRNRHHLRDSKSISGKQFNTTATSQPRPVHPGSHSSSWPTRPCPTVQRCPRPGARPPADMRGSPTPHSRDWDLGTHITRRPLNVFIKALSTSTPKTWSTNSEKTSVLSLYGEIVDFFSSFSMSCSDLIRMLSTGRHCAWRYTSF